MDVNKPIVSIIMATYNRAHFIMETLYSIQNQTFNDWECLIIDDGGTDATEQVIQPLLNKDERFKFLKRPITYQKGLPGCRNYGLDIAQGTYVIFFDDDDIVHPQNLEICVKEISKENLDFCYFKKKSFKNKFHYNFETKGIDLKVEKLAENFLEQMITQKAPIASCTVLWKRECFNTIRFNETLLYAEEWECYQRIISLNPKGAFLNKILYYNRKHEQSNTGEFWKGNQLRVASKKQAIVLVLQNLVAKKLVTPYLLKYLTGLAIAFRDRNLLSKLLKIARPSINKHWYIRLKYEVFPIWKMYKQLIKKIKAA